MDWIFEVSRRGGERGLATTGAILSGRHTCEVEQRALRPETSSADGGAWSGTEFVLTHQAKTAADNPDRSSSPATRTKKLEVLGTDITEQCLARGLVDGRRARPPGAPRAGGGGGGAVAAEMSRCRLSRRLGGGSCRVRLELPSALCEPTSRLDLEGITYALAANGRTTCRP